MINEQSVREEMENGSWTTVGAEEVAVDFKWKIYTAKRAGKSSRKSSSFQFLCAVVLLKMYQIRLPVEQQDIFD